jgi:hypothetical protein
VEEGNRRQNLQAHKDSEQKRGNLPLRCQPHPVWPCAWHDEAEFPAKQLSMQWFSCRELGIGRISVSGRFRGKAGRRDAVQSDRDGRAPRDLCKCAL